MDLSSMLNDGPAPEKKPAQASPSHAAPPPMPPTPGPNGGPPLYAAPLSRQTPGLTPLQTPSQGAGGTHQYPFPQQQPSQSPAAHQPPSQQYQAYGPHSATTPGPRPPSHGYQYAQPSPSQYQGPYLQHTSSLSPTPPSHASQTPHSIRQSPLSATSYGHPPPPPQQQHYQHSQPGTPLGPPPPQYPRNVQYGQHDIQSPYHQRTASGTSNGMVYGSPAQHHPSIGNLVDSPSAYNRPSPQLRRTSDYLSQIDRERSLSVSPKTKIPPRPPSLGSRQSSQQEAYSARSSFQYQQNVAPIAQSPSHVQTPSQASHQDMAQPPVLLHSSSSHLSANGAAQAASLSAQTPYPALTDSAPDHAANGPDSKFSLSQANDQPSSHLEAQSASMIQHQPQKMGMSHLLTPATSITSIDGAADVKPRVEQLQQEESTVFIKPKASPNMKMEAVVSPMKQEPVPESAPAEPSKKRPAESDLASEPPTKRGRTRKFTSRPVWARLNPRNPNYKAEEHAQAPPRPQTHHQALPPKPHAQANGVMPSVQAHPQPQSNGHPQVNGSSQDLPGWLQNPPLDNDLIRTRRILGAWEKSMRWTEPYLASVRAVSDWLWMNLAALKDVGNDPLEGAIEIEAKVGRIMKNNTDQRLDMPVMTPAVLSPEYCTKSTHFESQMEEVEHKAMNEFLNDCIRESKQKGRVPMDYKHPKQTDSFRQLSPAGIQALPPSFQKRRLPPGRELKLRTTVDNTTGKVVARIVKIPISDLHIFNPTFDYDLRISINLEANLNRPGLHPDDLVEDVTGNNLPPPDRRKDRLSYSHLAYSIDLTRVDVRGLAPKYELEVEVDAKVLREQIQRIEQGRENAYMDVVGGFLDNCDWLMRQKVKGV